MAQGRRVTQDEWRQRFAANGLELLGEVVNGRTKVLTRCKRGHEWTMRPSSVDTSGCPTCGRAAAAEKNRGQRRVTQKEWANRFAKQDLELLEEVKGTNHKVRVRCRGCEATFEKLASNVPRSGCPDCGRKAMAKKQSGKSRISQQTWRERFAAVRAEPLEEVTRANVPVATRCLECGNVWDANPSSISRGSGCRECGNRRQRLSQETWRLRFESQHLELLGQVENSAEPVLARCLVCDKEWEIRPNNVHSGGGCPDCRRSQAGLGRRIGREEIDRRAIAANITWLKEPHRATDRVPAECLECGHVRELAPAWAESRGCPNCAGQVVSQAEWESRAQRRGYTLLKEVSGRGGGLVPAKCNQCGGEWEIHPTNIGKSGCPMCARTGFDPSSPAYLYLVLKDDGTIKVGISGVGTPGRDFDQPYEQRLRRHAANGYRHLMRWYLDPGSLARAIERETVNRWRTGDGLPPAAPEGEDGYRETVNTALLPINEIVARIDALVAERKLPGPKGR